MAIDTGIAGDKAATARPSSPRTPAGRPALRDRLDALRRRPTAVATLVAIAIVALFGVVALTRGTGGYTSSDRASFIAGCLRNGGATQTQCGCMFDRIAAQLPHDAYARAGGATWSLRTSRAFSGAVVACTGADPGLAPPAS